MAIKAINDSANLNRLVLILLVFFLLKIYYLVNHHFFSKFWDSETYIIIAIVSEED